MTWLVYADGRLQHRHDLGPKKDSDASRDVLYITEVQHEVVVQRFAGFGESSFTLDLSRAWVPCDCPPTHVPRGDDHRLVELRFRRVEWRVPRWYSRRARELPLAWWSTGYPRCWACERSLRDAIQARSSTCDRCGATMCWWHVHERRFFYRQELK